MGTENMKAKRRKVVYLVLVIGILLTLIVVCVSQCALFHGTKIVKPSPVDTSILKPLADYPNYDLEELKVRIGNLQDKEGVQGFSGDAWNADPGSVWRFEGSTGGAIIDIWVYDRSEDALSILLQEGDETELIKVKISENVVATLTPVFQLRDSEAPWSYSGFNLLYTSVRIGNMVVDISESNDDVKGMGTDTNKALAQIVEVLLPDAKTP